MERLAILEGQLARNKGHSKNCGQLQEKRNRHRCFRCHLEYQIRKATEAPWTNKKYRSA